jgi:glycosyltransferase involved in cell wall biosynthesis
MGPLSLARIKSQLGNSAIAHHPLVRRLRNPSRWAYSRLLSSVGMQRQQGEQPFNPALPTVLVVSHEASTTGAPILALNLCQQLCGQANVIALLYRGGPLQGAFRASATRLLRVRRAFVNRKLVARELAWASQGQPIRYALVNSVVSAPLLEPIRNQGIACICLMHEFVTYVKPLEVFAEVGLWSSRVVCSTRLTWSDVLRHCSHLAAVPVEVLPQGQCQLPADPHRLPAQTAAARLPDAAERFLETLPATMPLVLGAGAVQPRKGVDLFIAAALALRSTAPEQPVRFAWIGSGYAPDTDFAVSVWLHDQIHRSNLSDDLVMLDESPAYQALIERCDLLVVSSRLDPLPNVAIDAMLAGKPVLCFADACGIAELLEQDPDLHSACVAPYFDCTELGRKALALLRQPDRLRELGRRSQALAQRSFAMPAYVRQLLALGETGRQEVAQQDRDIAVIEQERLIDRSFHTVPASLTERMVAKRYLLAWRSNIHPRKPFPGFHPGIYRERALPADSHHDPLVHWHQQGRPSGPWLAQVLRPQPCPVPPAGSTALHIHVFYPELLGPMLARLEQNQLQPDLYLSFSNPDLEPALQRILQQHNRSASLHPVPNRGRDIGPLLTELGQELDERYAFHGHLHTKKSVLIAADTAQHWREFLLTNLLGDRQQPMADRCITALQEQPDLGLIFPDDTGCINWSGNREQAQQLADRLGLPPLPEAINFPVGTMFWARRGALRRLYDLGLQWHHYPEEPLGYDGTMLHALERLLPLVCEASGFHYAVTHVPNVSR